MVNLTIDGKHIAVKEGTTILEAAKKAHINIPTLCKWKGLNEIGACRVCVVEVKGLELLPASCITAVEEGMEVYTNTPKVYDARKTNVQLILSQHNYECAVCSRNKNCELQDVVNKLNINDQEYEKDLTPLAWDKDFPLIRDNEKCIKCMRCIQVCDKISATGIWDLNLSGGRTTVWTKGGANIKDMDCTLCGQCITHCPVGALSSRDDNHKLLGVNGALADSKKVKVVSIAPAVRASWHEFLGLKKEEKSVKKLVGALKKMGFDYVFDVDFGADLTIMEEGSELIERMKNKDEHQWPMFTSCCPGWVRWVKSHYPEFVDNLSSAKSPNQMQAAIIKTYFAESIGKKPEEIYNVAVMPCVAKKAEADIPTINSTPSAKDVDAVLTIRELSSLIKLSGINLETVEECEFDSPLGESSGAGVIFGVTGGVMEASLRTAYHILTDKTPPVDAFKVIRNLGQVKEAEFKINDVTLKVGIVCGLKNTERLLERIKNNEVQYGFVEVMACPNGCIGGGGQPIHRENDLKFKARAKDIYTRDELSVHRNSYENPYIQKLYSEYLETPLSERAHHLLHTDHKSWELKDICYNK